MVVASFVLGIILFQDLNVFIYADSDFCTTKTTEIEDQHCKFKCHCNTKDDQCTLQNGTCGIYQSNCDPGWIGPKCQYSNLAYKENWADKVTDGNYYTCIERQTFTIELEKHYPISSFTVYASESNKTITKATVKNSTEDEDSYMNTCIRSSVMTKEKDFICTHTIVGRYLEVMFVSEETVCEIGIHGGRNIALWQNTEQSGTVQNSVYTSEKAVDGEIGDYIIYSNHCSHTAEHGYPGKPFWSVSFVQPYWIERIQIYFRKLQETIIRFSNYSVTIMHQGHTNGYYKKHGTPDKMEEIIFAPALGTNVTIQLPIEQNHTSNLNICEVQVFACNLRQNGETCTDTCPVNCKASDVQYTCQDYTCPNNQCIGDWKGKYCNQKECSILQLENKHFTISNGKDIKPRYLSGDKLSVACLPGYIIQEAGFIECRDNGQWHFGTTCIAKLCTIPIDQTLDTSIRGKQVHFNETLEIKCILGFRPRNDVTTNHCTINGIWGSGWDVPICEANKCKLPKDGHTHTNETGKSDVIFGTTIKITCDTGYHVKIPTVIQCQLNGSWSNTGLNAAPVCEEITCDLPKDKLVVTNVTTVEETVSYGTTITISCKDGYELKGPMVSYCQPNGKWGPGWNKSTLLCKEKHNLKHETHAQGNTTSNEQSDKKDGVAIGVGIGSAVFIVILLTVGITLFIKRRKNQNEKTKKNTNTETNDAGAGNVYCSIEETENEFETALTTDNTAAKEQSGYYSFLPDKGISRNAIKVENFIDYVEEKKGDDGPIASQFSSLLTGLQYPATVACFKQNKPKNKYKNIYAYDDTRVVLNRPNGKSDYINASYINGYDSVKRYIASQGPMKGTEEDFWEMVYQLRSDKIVMLTNVFEEGKQKCVQYWPDEDTVQFGSMSVQLKSVDRYADFTVRLLSINKDDNGWRNVRQFHFTSWPDRGVPKYASSLVQFRHKVLSMPTKGKGPLIVHCSAGIGRTGAFIALDILVSQAKSTGEMDVLACVETLRRQRVNMVQTAEQYQFLHHALEEALMCKTTATAAADFPEIYARMQQRPQNARKREIGKEFQTLNETSPVLQEEEFGSGKTAENKKKNRYSNIIPVESHRIYLSSYISGRSDYINAVMLPSYKESKAFIATQMPLPDTVVDFLCLVYDNDVSSIVMLNEMDDKTTLGRYWPENESELKIGPFTVTKSDDENMDNIVIQQLQIQYESKEPRIVKQFQIKFWPDADIIPSSVSDVLTLMELVQQWQRQAGGYNPVVVHCMNGCDKTGLYCVVEATIERLKIEQDVGIQQIIKQMRSRRPQIIPCIEQFEFCHEAVLEYMHQNETYSNFR